MSIPKKKKGEWKIGYRPGKDVFGYHEDTIRNRLKRRTDKIKKAFGISDEPTTIRGTKAQLPLTKRYNKPK
jgi:predicted ABC-type ATPase